MSLFAGAFGYDAEVLARLPPRARAPVHRAALLALVSAVLCGASAGYGVALATGSLGNGVAAALAALLFVWNLLRLVAAGAGIPAHLDVDEARRWRPGLAPAVVFSLFAGITAQPALLFVAHDRLENEVILFRDRLVALHEEAVVGPLDARRRELEAREAELQRRVTREETRLSAATNGPASALERDAAAEAQRTLAFLRPELERVRPALAAVELELRHARTDDLAQWKAHLASMSFPVHRLQLAWARRGPAAGFTLAFMFVVLLPLFARRFGGPGFLAYELARYDAQRSQITADHDTCAAFLEPLVARFPGWHPPPPPFARDEDAGWLARRGRRFAARELLERLPGPGPRASS